MSKTCQVCMDCHWMRNLWKSIGMRQGGPDSDATSRVDRQTLSIFKLSFSMLKICEPTLSLSMI